MRIEELSPSKFYAIIVDADISLEDVNNIEATMKAKGINVVVLAGDGPTGPVVQRYWGVYFPDKKAWAKKSDGELYYYPSAGIAAAHAEDWSNAKFNTIDGRGRPLFTDKIEVREMVHADAACYTKGYQSKPANDVQDIV